VQIKDYLDIIRRHWLIVFILLVLSTATGMTYSLLATKQYDATAKLYVSVRGTDSATDMLQGTNYARQAVTSYVDVVKSKLVLDQVIEDLGLDLSTGQLASKISAQSPANSVLINITLRDPNPQMAAELANSVAQVFTDVVANELDRPVEGSSPVRVTVVSPAAAPSRAAAPRVSQNLALSILVGLAFGAGAALLRNATETRIRSREDIERLSDKPILGLTARDSDPKKRSLLLDSDTLDPRAEAYRRIRASLMFSNIEGSANTIIVTSPGPSEGKTVTAANLSISLADSGFKVLLVDCDLHRPRIATYMGLEGGAGLTDVLIGRATVEEVTQRWGNDQLYVLAAGRLPPNPSRLLGSSAMQGLHQALARQYDFVLLDSPPLLLTTDAVVLSRTVESEVVLVGAMGTTRKRSISAALAALETVDAQVLGLILTMAPTKTMDVYGYGDYNYGYAYRHGGPGLRGRKRRQAAKKQAQLAREQIRTQARATSPASPEQGAGIKRPARPRQAGPSRQPQQASWAAVVTGEGYPPGQGAKGTSPRPAEGEEPSWPVEWPASNGAPPWSPVGPDKSAH